MADGAPAVMIQRKGAVNASGRRRFFLRFVFSARALRARCRQKAMCFARHYADRRIMPTSYADSTVTPVGYAA
jgi:hypothetical protein